jgi:hypothetical protein
MGAGVRGVGRWRIEKRGDGERSDAETGERRDAGMGEGASTRHAAKAESLFGPTKAPLTDLVVGLQSQSSAVGGRRHTNASAHIAKTHPYVLSRADRRLRPEVGSPNGGT